VTSYERPSLAAQDAVEDLLDLYAELRLSPKKPVLARMRTAVMADARSVAARSAAEQREAASAGLTPGAVPTRHFGFPRLRLASLARPAFALGFAGLLAIGTGTAITAASPGSPLYMARVGLEQVFLPVQVDARFASHQQHLDERLAEAEAAAANGDADALEAALAAYQDEVDQTLADVGDDYGRLEHFEGVLESHVVKLTALSKSLPTEVARGNAEEHAAEASASAVTKATETVAKVKDRKAQSNNKPASPPAQNDPPNHPSAPAGDSGSRDERP
jgi:hypothetical protein